MFYLYYRYFYILFILRIIHKDEFVRLVRETTNRKKMIHPILTIRIGLKCLLHLFVFLITLISKNTKLKDKQIRKVWKKGRSSRKRKGRSAKRKEKLKKIEKELLPTFFGPDMN